MERNGFQFFLLISHFESMELFEYLKIRTVVLFLYESDVYFGIAQLCLCLYFESGY